MADNKQSPTSQTRDDIALLRARISQAMVAHSTRDSFYYNATTLAALAATTTATVLPDNLTLWIRIASGIATFVIAMSRSLDFGARWRWHVNMRSRYETLFDRINAARFLPEADQPAAFSAVYDELFTIRSLESTIPGTGAPWDGGHPGQPAGDHLRTSGETADSR